jgi:hypothetical protein
MPVKGIVTARLLYEDVSARPMADVDVRVAREDFRRLLAVARERGWRPRTDSPHLWEAVLHVGEWTVDIECAFSDPGLCAIPMRTAIARATRSVAPFEFEHLQPELHDHVLLLVLNAFKDGLETTPWAREDLLRIVRLDRFEVDLLVRRAHEGRVVSATWIVANWLATEHDSAKWREVRDTIGQPPSERVSAWYRRALDRGWNPKTGMLLTACSSDSEIGAWRGIALALAGIARGRWNRLVAAQYALPVAVLALTMCGGNAADTSSPADGGVDSWIGGDASYEARPESGGSSSGTDSGSGSSSGASPEASAGDSVLMYHNHLNRDGFFVDPLITSGAARTFSRDTTFDGTVHDNVYASPLYVENGIGGRGAFYVATEGNNLYALDESTGRSLWPGPVNFGTPAKQTGIGAGCGNISPLGITGTPAIDLSTRLIVFDAVSADANMNIGTHTIYGVSIDDGRTQWSVDVSTLKDPTGVSFSPQLQNQRAAVLIVGGTAYVAFGGHMGDCGEYHGWLVGVPLSGKGAKAWATGGTGAGIWGVGGPASDGQSIFVTTGNDNASILSPPQSEPMSPWPRSEGILRFDPGPTFSGQTADYFTPHNWWTMDQGDVDLGGSGPLVIDAPAITPSKLVMAEGKDGILYLVDRTNMGGVAPTDGNANVGALIASGGEISNGAAFATIAGTTYVVLRPNGGTVGYDCPNGTTGELVAVKLDPTSSSKMSLMWCANAMGAGSPIITTSDGSKDPLVWVPGGDPNNDPDDTNQLHAFDLGTGKIVFGGGSSNDAFSSTVHHFATPAAVHGRIFVPGDGRLYAFK